jgi:hypothetical protein
MIARLALVIFAVLLVACAPGLGPAASGEPGQSIAPLRPLALLIGREPASLLTRALGQAGSMIAAARRLFNATLTLVDATGASGR